MANMASTPVATWYRVRTVQRIEAGDEVEACSGRLYDVDLPIADDPKVIGGRNRDEARHERAELQSAGALGRLVPHVPLKYYI